MSGALPEKVAQAYAGFPPDIQVGLLRIRAMIFEMADAVEAGPITETLKWGEPAYLTETTRSGSTIRLGVSKQAPDRCAVFFNCHTDLVEGFRERFADVFAFEGRRALIVSEEGSGWEAALAICLGEALTYHRRR